MTNSLTGTKSDAPVAERMRLIHAIFNDDLHATGMTDVLEVICERALARGWTFEVIAPEVSRGSKWSQVLAGQGAVIHYVPSGDRRNAANHIGGILGEDPCHALLHTHGTSFDIPAAMAARGRRHVSVFWHVHSFLPSGVKASLRLRLKFTLFRRTVDRVVAQSVNIRDGLVRVGVPADRVVMFSSSIEPERFPLRTAEQRAAERDRLQIPAGTNLLLHFGWNWEIKGTDRLLAAVKLLVDSGTDVIALVNRGGERASREADELGLSDNVRIGELVEDTRPLYAAADCMVAPSRGEGMPFSLVEALATGLPVAASDLPGHRYLADHIDACRVTDAGDPAALAGAIKSILERPGDQAAAEADQGRQWIVRHLNIDTVVDGLFVNYDQALRERELAQ